MEQLKIGSTGTMVELLQLALERSGFYSYLIDGVFGSRTLNAVHRFQSSFGLIPDGVVGNETYSKLRPFIVGYFKTKLRPGDTFYRLAKRYGTTVAAIETANPDCNAEALRIGDIVTIPYGFDLVPTNVHYSSLLMDLLAEGFKARYPFIEINSIGNSVMGRPIYLFIIGNGENELSFNATHHANEWITTPLVLSFAENYLNSYINHSTMLGRKVESLFESTKLFLIPMVNPDGVDLVADVLQFSNPYYNEAKAIASDYPFVRFPEGWKANISGTDLNLNYPADWERAKEIKYAKGFISPAPRDYVGSEPLSAPESKAVYDLTLKTNFKIILAFHTQGQVIYWKFGELEPPDAFEIGQKFSMVSGYDLDDVPDESGYAGYKDWFILNYNRPGYTIEAGLGINPLPLSQFKTIHKDNSGIMMTALEVVSKCE